MQVAVSDRRQQFDAWNVGFRNHIGPFDLGFHSRCNNDYCNVNEGLDQNQHNSPGLYHHTSQNWNYWLHARPVGGGGGGGTPDFKWQEWSNGGKNHNTKKSLGLQTKLPKHTWTKIQPQSQKFHTQKTSSIIPFTWNLAPPPQCMVITQVTPRAPLPVVLCKLEDPSVNCKSQVLVRLASWKLITANSLSIDTSIKGTPH